MLPGLASITSKVSDCFWFPVSWHFNDISRRGSPKFRKLKDTLLSSKAHPYEDFILTFFMAYYLFQCLSACDRSSPRLILKFTWLHHRREDRKIIWCFNHKMRKSSLTFLNKFYSHMTTWLSHLSLLEIIRLIVTLELWELLKIILSSATYELKPEILGKPVTLVQLELGDEFG